MANRQTLDVPRYMEAYRSDVTARVPALGSYIGVRPITRVKAQGRLPNIDLTVVV